MSVTVPLTLNSSINTSPMSVYQTLDRFTRQLIAIARVQHRARNLSDKQIAAADYSRLQTRFRRFFGQLEQNQVLDAASRSLLLEASYLMNVIDVALDPASALRGFGGIFSASVAAGPEGQGLKKRVYRHIDEMIWGFGRMAVVEDGERTSEGFGAEKELDGAIFEEGSDKKIGDDDSGIDM